MAFSGFTFVIPGKPVPWQRVQRGRNGRAFVPKRTREYEHHVGMCALSARNTAERMTKTPWPLDARYSLHAKVYGARANADVDNVGKCVLDGLEGICFSNDKQVTRLTVERCAKDAGGPRVEVAVEVLG